MDDSIQSSDMDNATRLHLRERTAAAAELRSLSHRMRPSETDGSSSEASNGGFSLSSLALLVTFGAITLTSVDLDRWKHQFVWLTATDPWPLVALFGGAGLFGMLIGLAHPCIFGFNWRNTVIAPISGILAGWIGAVLLAAAGPLWLTLFSAAVLLISVVLFRLKAE